LKFAKTEVRRTRRLQDLTELEELVIGVLITVEKRPTNNTSFRSEITVDNKIDEVRRSNSSIQHIHKTSTVSVTSR